MLSRVNNITRALRKNGERADGGGRSFGGGWITEEEGQVQL